MINEDILAIVDEEYRPRLEEILLSFEKHYKKSHPDFDVNSQPIFIDLSIVGGGCRCFNTPYCYLVHMSPIFSTDRKIMKDIKKLCELLIRAGYDDVFIREHLHRYCKCLEISDDEIITYFGLLVVAPLILMALLYYIAYPLFQFIGIVICAIFNGWFNPMFGDNDFFYAFTGFIATMLIIIAMVAAVFKK